MNIEHFITKYILDTNGEFRRVDEFYSTPDCRVVFNCGWQSDLISQKLNFRLPYIELEIRWDDHGSKNEISLNEWKLKVEVKNALADTINDKIIHPDFNIKFVFVDPNGSIEEHVVNGNINDIADKFKLFCSYSPSRSLAVAKYELEISILKSENEKLFKEVMRLRTKLESV